MLGTRFGRLLFNVFWRDYGCEAETCSRWASQGTYFRPTDGLHAFLFIRDRLLAGQPFLLRFGNIRVLTDLYMMDLYGVIGEVPPKEKIKVPPTVAIYISPQFDFVALQPYRKRDTADEPSPPRKRSLNREGWGSLNWAVMDGVSITIEFHGHALCHGQACGRLTRFENNFAYEGWNLRGIINSQRLMTGRLNRIFGPGKLVGRHSQVIIDAKESIRFDRKGTLPLAAGVMRVVILSVLRTDLSLSGDTLPPEEHGWVETAWAAVGPRSPVARESSDRSQHGEGWALNSWMSGGSTSVVQDVVADGDSGLSGFGYSKPTWQRRQYTGSRVIIEDERSPVGQGWSDNRWSAALAVEELERNTL
ncbi:hypothetical protein CDD81_2664 [Ophiocordyceps australis]|uniref:Uncharacterized protein n=1 Tax=Ophiocordyceps australis TaxID=1399860 RepID=A0A2C5XXK3_9HYPO|nr:hypothetical protein CDD81_2664 [Ophiocordyceps australis]